MRTAGRVLGRVPSALGLLAGASRLIAPGGPVDTAIGFDEVDLPHSPDRHPAWAGARFPEIAPGAGKRIVWASAPGEKTDFAVIYLHGFSGASEEIRSVPDRVAEAIAGDWLKDAAAAPGMGKRIAARRGGEVGLLPVAPGPGDALSPSQTAPAAAAVLDRAVRL